MMDDGWMTVKTNSARSALSYRPSPIFKMMAPPYPPAGFFHGVGKLEVWEKNSPSGGVQV